MRKTGGRYDFFIFFFAAGRSTQRGTHTTHGISIQRLDFSVDRFEVHLFHFFCCFQNRFTNAAEIKNNVTFF